MFGDDLNSLSWLAHKSGTLNFVIFFVKVMWGIWQIRIVLCIVPAYDSLFVLEQCI